MKQFDINNLYHPIEAEFLPHAKVQKGEGLALELNLDILTLDYIDEQEKFFSGWIREQQAKIGKPAKKGAKKVEELKENMPDPVVENLKFDIRYKAMVLGGRPGENDPAKRVIVSWGLIRNEKQVPVSFEELCRFSQPLLDKLYTFCTKEAAEVSKKTEPQ